MYPKLFNNQFNRGTNRLVSWNYNWESIYFITICTSQKQHFFGKVIKDEMILNEFGKIAFNEWAKTQEIRKDMNVELFDFVIMPNHMHAIIKIGWNQYNTQIIDPNDLTHTQYSNESRGCAMHRAATGNVATATGNVATATGNVASATGNVATATGNVATATGNVTAATNDTPLVQENDGINRDIEAMDYSGNNEATHEDIFTSFIIPDKLDDLIGLKKKSINKFGPQAKNLASIIRGFKSAVTTQIRIRGDKEFEWQSRFHEHIIRNERAFKNIQKYIINNPKNWAKK